MHFDPIVNEILDNQQADAASTDHGSPLAGNKKGPGDGENRGDDRAGHHPGFGQANSGGNAKGIVSANPEDLADPAVPRHAENGLGVLTLGVAARPAGGAVAAGVEEIGSDLVAGSPAHNVIPDRRDTARWFMTQNVWQSRTVGEA